MLIVIPTRIIPGVLAATGFLSVGVGSGFLAAVPFLQPTKFRPGHLIFVPAFFVTLFFIRLLWRQDPATDSAAEITAVTPRLLSVIFAVCLAFGMAAGATIVYATATP